MLSYADKDDRDDADAQPQEPVIKPLRQILSGITIEFRYESRVAAAKRAIPDLSALQGAERESLVHALAADPALNAVLTVALLDVLAQQNGPGAFL